MIYKRSTLSITYISKIKSMKNNQKIKIQKFLTITALCVFIYLGFSILSGLNTLNAIQADQRNSLRSIACDTLNNDEYSYKCSRILNN